MMSLTRTPFMVVTRKVIPITRSLIVISLDQRFQLIYLHQLKPASNIHDQGHENPRTVARLDAGT